MSVDKLAFTMMLVHCILQKFYGAFTGNRGWEGEGGFSCLGLFVQGCMYTVPDL